MKWYTCFLGLINDHIFYKKIDVYFLPNFIFLNCCYFAKIDIFYNLVYRHRKTNVVNGIFLILYQVLFKKFYSARHDLRKVCNETNLTDVSEKYIFCKLRNLIKPISLNNYQIKDW